MDIKIDCPCGTRYGFDVEPENGRMPTTVACPTCGADGTDAANAILQSRAPRPIRVSLSTHGTPTTGAAIRTSPPVAGPTQ